MKSTTYQYQKQEQTRKRGEVANRRLQNILESASGEVKKFAEKRIGAERVLPEDRDLRLWQVSEIFYLREVGCVTGEKAPRRGYSQSQHPGSRETICRRADHPNLSLPDPGGTVQFDPLLRPSEGFHALFHPVGLELNQKPLYGLPVAWIVREVPNGRHGVVERPSGLEVVPEGRWGPLSDLTLSGGLLLPAACLRACARLWASMARRVVRVSWCLTCRSISDFSSSSTAQFEPGQGMGLFGRKALGV